MRRLPFMRPGLRVVMMVLNRVLTFALVRAPCMSCLPPDEATVSSSLVLRRL